MKIWVYVYVNPIFIDFYFHYIFFVLNHMLYVLFIANLHCLVIEVRIRKIIISI